ncbi:MAG: PucR family transcriptional regulator, partial [Lachnospiraceae bacterium]|nr:PucR family transcriptional regulator [Lachnospiraceae bacterium]
MISNQILQSTIDGIKGIARVDLTVADVDGKVIVTTHMSAPNLAGAIIEFAKSPADSQEIQNSQF